MSLSTLPLSYCTNVHPGTDLDSVMNGLKTYSLPIQKLFGSPISAGLWLADSVAREILVESDRLPRFAAELVDLGIRCHSLNAFPYGNFHSRKVKDLVYLPHWADPDRLRYTIQSAGILAELLPENGEGSISTLPLGFKGHRQQDDFLPSVVQNLIQIAERLHRIRSETGKIIRLAIEPEPFCLLETTSETVDFFHHLRRSAPDSRSEDLLREYIGVCYDVCHQAVEFEEISQSVNLLDESDIRINKLHITCALQLDQPANNLEGRRYLAEFAEPRYLHQMIGRSSDGLLVKNQDLSAQIALTPPPEWMQADTWRIHFHVPVDAEWIGPLRTTRDQLKQALQEVSHLNYAPHLEVETYTWGVLPNSNPSEATDCLIRGISAELSATRKLLDEME